jgi:hypothetical protein
VSGTAIIKAVPTALAYDLHVEQLFEVLRRFHQSLQSAHIPYRVVGGMAVFFHVNDVEPLRARLTRDVDVAIDRSDLPRIIEAVKLFGFRHRHAAGVDLLVDETQPKTRSAVHFVFVSEKVHNTDLTAIPEFSEAVPTEEGILLAPVADLVRMKLTAFRLKDQVHIQDMDSVGLITPEIEAQLPDPLRERLTQVRATR